MKIDLNLNIQCWRHQKRLVEESNETGFFYVLFCPYPRCKVKVRISK